MLRSLEVFFDLCGTESNHKLGNTHFEQVVTQPTVKLWFPRIVRRHTSSSSITGGDTGGYVSATENDL